MSSKDEEEVAKKELLPAPKKAKSARFEVSGVGVGDEKKKGEDDGEETYNMTHQGTHQGSHQFTQYAKSFRHYLTRDVLPSEHNYRNLLSFRNNAAKRPTMQELREEEIMMKNKEVRLDFYSRGENLFIGKFRWLLIQNLSVNSHFYSLLRITWKLK